MYFTDGEAWIPATFDARNSILLIQEAGEIDSKNKLVVSFMQTNYPYQYEIVPIYDTVKFQDRTRYRFMLMTVPRKVVSIFEVNNWWGENVYAIDYAFYDRLTGTWSKQIQKGSAYDLKTFKPVMRTIVKHVEASSNSQKKH
jgi:hypothetical protein